MESITIGIGIAGALILLYYCRYVTIRSTFGNEYQVAVEFKDKQTAANILDRLNTFAINILRHMQNDLPNMSSDNPMRPLIINLLNRYNPDVVRENRSYLVSDTSFVIDKGATLALCLRDNSGKFHDFSLLQFVLLHEMTHIASDSDAGDSHPPAYWRDFRRILDYVAGTGLYQPVDYSKTPVLYCGQILLQNNPYFNGR